MGMVEEEICKHMEVVEMETVGEETYRHMEVVGMVMVEEETYKHMVEVEMVMVVVVIYKCMEVAVMEKVEEVSYRHKGEVVEICNNKVMAVVETSMAVVVNYNNKGMVAVVMHKHKGFFQPQL